MLCSVSVWEGQIAFRSPQCLDMVVLNILRLWLYGVLQGTRPAVYPATVLVLLLSVSDHCQEVCESFVKSAGTSVSDLSSRHVARLWGRKRLQKKMLESRLSLDPWPMLSLSHKTMTDHWSMRSFRQHHLDVGPVRLTRTTPLAQPASEVRVQPTIVNFPKTFQW